MKLSQEERDQMADHFKNKDLYDPSKAPEQETASFAPDMPGMNCGGEMGYAAGGDVEDGIDLGNPFGASGPPDFSGPSLSADTETARVPLTSAPAMPPQPPIATMAQPALPVARPAVRPAPSVPMADDSETPEETPAVAAVASPVKSLQSDEYNQLLQYLQPSAGRRFGQAAFSGLAGLADAIMTGVAKAPSSSFQKNIAEMDQNKRKDLISALENKYAAGFKGRELGLSEKKATEEGRHNRAEEKETRAARKLTQQAQDLAAKQHGGQLGLEKAKLETEENKAALEQAQHTGGLWNKLKGVAGLGIPGPDPAILARAQGAGPAAAAHPQDLQAISWAKANPRDPRAAKILRANGQ